MKPLNGTFRILTGNHFPIGYLPVQDTKRARGEDKRTQMNANKILLKERKPHSS